ncbi:MAG TPA: type II toxin-antitoxin system RelE/ParE family toxin [Gammaproteobacteria bacterium]|nr:type II toxin-antitoxin system RelE/ParE family toxin [Gammaproteobacteria bacterium]
MQIRWLEDAVNDLVSLRQYIANNNPRAAHRIANKILSSVDHLSLHPGLGRSGRVPGTRELIIPSTPFLIPYRVAQDTVEILRVLHVAMEWRV